MIAEQAQVAALQRALKHVQEAILHCDMALQQVHLLPTDAAGVSSAVRLSVARNTLTRTVEGLNSKHHDLAAAARRAFTTEVGEGLRRFGPFPFDQPGIPTAAAAYAAGYEVGVQWTARYIPGGPACLFARDGRGSFVQAHEEAWQVYCEATQENHREWVRGWHDGKAEKDRTP